MAAPLIHIFSTDIREGQLEGYKAYAQEYAEFVEARHPRLLAFHQYVSEDGGRAFTIQIHPDSDSMDFFMKKVITEHAVRAYEFLERGSERSDVYGTLSSVIQDQLRQYGVALSVRPQHLCGFTRLQGG
jgi:hypothetical protein